MLNHGIIMKLSRNHWNFFFNLISSESESLKSVSDYVHEQQLRLSLQIEEITPK